MYPSGLHDQSSPKEGFKSGLNTVYSLNNRAILESPKQRPTRFPSSSIYFYNPVSQKKLLNEYKKLSPKQAKTVTGIRIEQIEKALKSLTEELHGLKKISF